MHFKFEDDIVLENDRLLLRPISIPDIENLIKIAAGQPTLLQFSPKQIHSKSLLTKYVENAIIERAGKSRYTFCIYNKADNCYAGSTAFINISNADDRLEIGATWMDRRLHGTGFNRHCKYLMLHYAFETVGANRVEFRTDERNLQSRKAIEKIGAKFEGVLRKHTLMYDGFIRNTVCYSILKEEWNMLKQNFL